MTVVERRGCYYAPVDESNRHRHVNKDTSRGPRSIVNTLGEVTLVAVDVVVCGFNVSCRCEPYSKESPDNEPPEYSETLKDEECDPVE